MPSPNPDSVHPLPRSFFARTPRRVARDLLGKLLIRSSGGQHLSARIVEVEAYLGVNDPAAHAAVGNTPRTSVLFGPPGHAYIYFIYGNYYCLNVSCETEGKAGSVLIRALEPIAGVEHMSRARHISIENGRDLLKLTSGPGRLAQAFSITRDRDNGVDLTSPTSTLWMGSDSFRPSKIQITPRVGITKAASHLLRYILPDNPFVSSHSRLASRLSSHPALHPALYPKTRIQ